MDISRATIRKVAISFAMILTFAIVGYRYLYMVAPTVEKIRSIFKEQPCTTPIAYSIGQFDTRFGITRAQFLDDADSASRIWAEVVGRPLFVYSDSGALKIDLLYDDRQQATVDMQTIGASIADNKKTYDALKAEYDSLSRQYDSQKSTLNVKIASYTSSLNAYQTQVSYWNAKGSIPKQQSDILDKQRTDLNGEAADINSDTQALNATANKVNTISTSLNQLAHKLNLSVTNLNSIGASTGVEFDEGEYVSDDTGQRIDIYQYSNNRMLIRVLAHEMGHAIGLDHVDDPKAIMYPLNQSTNMVPTSADILELDTVCGIK